MRWFSEIANHSPYPVYLYDLPSVTQSKITMPIIDRIINHPNIHGIKTADWKLIVAIERKYPGADFTCLCSRLDSFDYINALGIGKNLDGVFACTPKNATAMYKCIANGDLAGARVHLHNILLLRDTMINHGLLRCFTVCMNLLGYKGDFHYDYNKEIDLDKVTPIMRDIMQTVGEL